MMKIKAALLSIIFIPAMGLAAVNSSSPAATALDISGEYHCQGFDPYFEQNYSSTMTITQVNKRIYSISDQTLVARDSGSARVDVFSDRETGILDNNILAISYQNRRDPTQQGVEQVTFDADANSLFGLWAEIGGTMIGTETCFRLPAKHSSS